MSYSDCAVKRYKYDFYTYFTLYGVIFLTTFAISMTILAFILNILWAAVLFFALTVIMFFASMATFFVSSTIVICDEGISSYKLGWRMKIIHWRDVQKSRKWRIWNYYEGYRSFFYVYDQASYVGFIGKIREFMKNWRGPIAFSDRIKNLPELLEQINAYSQRYGFPLVVEDEEIATEQAVQSGSSYIKRRFPKTNEVQVEKF